MPYWIYILLSYALSQITLRLLVKNQYRNIEKNQNWEETSHFEHTQMAIDEGKLPTKIGSKLLGSTVISTLSSVVVVFSAAWLISPAEFDMKLNYLIAGAVSLPIFIYATFRNAFWFLAAYYAKKALDMDVSKEEKWL